MFTKEDISKKSRYPANQRINNFTLDLILYKVQVRWSQYRKNSRFLPQSGKSNHVRFENANQAFSTDLREKV